MTSLAPNLGSGGVDLWTQRFHCRRGEGDVWVLHDVDTVV